MNSWTAKAVLPSVDPAEDLGGFSLAQFRRFLSGLLPFCHYLCWFEDGADRVLGLEHPFGSQPLITSIKRFTEWLGDVTALSGDAVTEILEMLTFNPTKFHERVICRPFFLVAGDVLATSPRLWIHLDLERLLVGALNASGRRAYYDKLINEIERNAVRQIAKLLEQHPQWEVVCQRTFDAGGEKITPDFVIREPKTGRVLIVDYKHAMEGSGPDTVRNKIKDLTAWIVRMREYREFIEANRRLLDATFRSQAGNVAPWRIDGLILSRWPLPVPIVGDTGIPICDWFGFRDFCSSREPDIGSILKWASERPEIVRPSSVKVAQEEITVGGWTYVRSILRSGD